MAWPKHYPGPPDSFILQKGKQAYNSFECLFTIRILRVGLLLVIYFFEMVAACVAQSDHRIEGSPPASVLVLR